MCQHWNFELIRTADSGPRYALLDVDHSVGVEDLRLAYRRAIRRAHPDKGGSSEAFLAVARAFETSNGLSHVMSCNVAVYVHHDQ